MPWFKGNIHCHSSNSDGRATAQNTAKFYKFNGYDFIGISDHNSLTPVENYANQAGITGIPCCEFTAPECCHVVGVNMKNSVSPEKEYDSKSIIKGFSAEESFKIRILQDGVDKINKNGGIPILCHPFWYWVYDWKIAAAVKNWKFFEICNASPDCNSYPTPAGSPGDEMWDNLLSSGHKVFGVASDDAHEYFSPYNPHSPCAGKGFIVVKSEKLEAESIVRSIIAGDFYASTGIELEEYEITRKQIKIKIKRYAREIVWFQFFGKNGKELAKTKGLEAVYEIGGSEEYVRCRMASSTGAYAWTQPVFISGEN